MVEFGIGILVYTVGVITSVVLVAWINASSKKSIDDIPLWAAGFSWLFVLAILILLVCYPIKVFYDYMYKVFESRMKG